MHSKNVITVNFDIHVHGIQSAKLTSGAGLYPAQSSFDCVFALLPMALLAHSYGRIFPKSLVGVSELIHT